MALSTHLVVTRGAWSRVHMFLGRFGKVYSRELRGIETHRCDDVRGAESEALAPVIGDLRTKEKKVTNARAQASMFFFNRYSMHVKYRHPPIAVWTRDLHLVYNRAEMKK